MHYWNGDWHWTMMLGMAVFWILVIVAVIWGIRFLMMQQGQSGNRQDSAEEILRRRFASGELTKEEYEERLGALRH